MQTGDLSVFEAVRENVDFMLGKMEEFRVQPPSGLYSYRHGCNMFMYQADHLIMPGESVSPSVMMAYDYQQMATLCRKAGYAQQAERYEKRAASLWSTIVKRLWNADAQCFYNHIDLQGKAHNAHYYNDLVMPQLYSPLEEKYRLASLAYMKHSLMHYSHTTGLPLMRVGDLKPTIFGNDNVMPLQMAETARALFQTGDTALATAFMEAVAFASTIYSESPGSMPEYMDDEGRGSPNWKFSPGTASFLYTYITGLFGLYVDGYGTALHVEPAFPDDWDNAELCLPYGKMTFVREKADTIRLHIGGAAAYETVVVGITVPPCSGAKITVNGVSYPVEMTPLIGHTRLRALVSADVDELDVTVTLRLQELETVDAVETVEGQAVALPLPPAYAQEVVDGRVAPGRYCVYAASQKTCALLEVPVTVKPQAAVLDVTVSAVGDDRCRISLLAELPLEDRLLCEVRNLSAEGAPVLLHQELQGNGGVFGAAVVLNQQSPAAYTALLECVFSHPNTGTCVYSERRSVSWKNPCKKESLAAHKIELGELATDEKIYSPSRWRNAWLPLGLSGVNEDHPQYEQNGYWFSTENSRENGQYRRFCLLCGGLSDPATCELRPGEYRSTVTLPVGRCVRTLDLLYVSEVESRLTGSVVGCLTLHYTDGTTQALPLEAGKQIGAMFHNFAAETDKLGLAHLPFCDLDTASILSVGCDVNRKLESFTLTLDTRDASLALMAATVLW